MFTEFCFIRKRSIWLIRELDGFGYKCNQSLIQPISHLLVVGNGCYACSFPYNCADVDKFIDCGTNEKLFLAIAALRDDSDKNQWFVCKEKDIWWLCEFDKFEDEFDIYKDETDLECNDYKKATVEELIEYFRMGGCGKEGRDE